MIKALGSSWLAASSLAALAAGAAVPVSHPVFPAAPMSAAQRTEARAAAAVLAMAPAEIDRWIVLKSSFDMVACPHCEWPGGRRDRKDYWRWSPDRPDELHCTHCGIIYPDPRYPLSAVQETVDPTGQVQRFPYYPGKDGYRYYLEGRLDNLRKQHLEGQALRLARLYAATGEASCARQAAVLLERFARAYPHYNPQISRCPGRPRLLEMPILQPAEDGLVTVPPFGKGSPGRDDGAYYPYWSNRRGDGWNGWFYSEMPIGLAYAFDAIAASPELDRLSADLGRDVRAAIRGFLRDTANYARSFPPYAGNMDPSLIQGFAVIGRVIGEPELVHDALRRLQLILDLRFYPDGNWEEGAPSYHAQTVAGLRAAVQGPLKGYSDPPGYVGRDDGRHLENLDIGKDLPWLGETARALEAMTLPNGAHVGSHDTWSPTTNGRALRRPPAAPMPSHLHWGMGHAILGTGRQDTGTQLHLHFSGGYGHQHADTLNLILFAKGQELVADLGYTHTVLAPYVRGSLAHNLVVVDETDQRTSGTAPPADGRLVASARLGRAVQFVEAGGEGAYPGRTRLYRRAVALVAGPNGQDYVLDVFRVVGGRRHDWVLHGSADADMSLHSTRPSRPHPAGLLPPGTTFTLWPSEYGQNRQGNANLSYGLFRNLARGTADDTVAVTMATADGVGVATTLLGLAGAAVFTGELPSMRRACEDSSRVLDYWRPTVMVRRDGDDLQSVFTAVHQPIDATTRRLAVQRLEAASDDALAVAIRVEGDGFTDIHLCGAGPTSRWHLPALDLEAVGRYAFVRIVDDRLEAMGLADGAALTCRGQALGVRPGRVVEVQSTRADEQQPERWALVVRERLAPRPADLEERVVVSFADGMTYGLHLAAIADEGEGSALRLRHRPGFTVDPDGTTRMTHHPRRTTPTRPECTLPGGGVWEHQPPEAPRTPANRNL